MKHLIALSLLAGSLIYSVPASAQSNGGANCVAGFASSSQGVPAFVSDLMMGFGRFFGILVRNDCDLPDD